MVDRRSGGDGKRTRRGASGAGGDSRPTRVTHYRQLINPFAPAQVFSADHVEHIHNSALSLLESEGLRVLSTRARQVFARAGAIVDESTQIVRLDRALTKEAVAHAPRTVQLVAQRTECDACIGDQHMVIAPVIGPPNVADLDRGRRPGNLEAFCDFVKLTQSFDVLHVLGPAVEPQDVPTAERHLRTTLAQLTLSDKVPWIFCRGRAQIADCFEMVRIARGITKEDFPKRAYAYTVVNTNSPRQIDIPMAEGIMDFADAGQLVIVTPFTLAGAMAPITIVGALMLAHAEALAGITLAQITRAGAPVVYGSFTSNVDMKSGSPAFGTPEYTKAAIGAGQLARHIGLPWRSSNATAANWPDAQAAYESQMSLWGAVLGGCNVLLHGAGWLEGGLSASYEKFILDVEMLQMLAEVFQPLVVDSAELGLDAIVEVGPGGHFFSAQHTMARYRTAFYPPLVSDWRNFGTWTDDGAKTVDRRANGVWKQVLQDYVPPERDLSVLNQLQDFVAKRVAEGGADPVS